MPKEAAGRARAAPTFREEALFVEHRDRVEDEEPRRKQVAK